MTKISIIIPVYNAEKYLSKCIDSILLQTYENLEIICINDGSVDNSLKILNDYQQKDNRIIVHSIENSGASAARNFGFSLATGEYISYIDADDWLNLTLYETFIKANSKTPVDIWLYNMGFYYEETRNILPKTSFQLKDWKNYQSDESILTFDDCKNPFCIGTSAANKIYSRKFLEKNNFQFLENSIFEDSLFNFETLLAAESIKIDFEIFYWYNKSNENSVTKTYKKNAFDIFIILDKIKELIQIGNQFESYKYALFQFYYCSLFDLFRKVDSLYREDFYNAMKESLNSFAAQDFDKNICNRLKDFRRYECFILSKNAEEFFTTLKGN